GRGREQRGHREAVGPARDGRRGTSRATRTGQGTRERSRDTAQEGRRGRHREDGHRGRQGRGRTPRWRARGGNGQGGVTRETTGGGFGRRRGRRQTPATTRGARGREEGSGREAHCCAIWCQRAARAGTGPRG